MQSGPTYGMQSGPTYGMQSGPTYGMQSAGPSAADPMRQLQMHTRIRQRASVRERFKLLSPVQVAALPHKLSLDC